MDNGLYYRRARANGMTAGQRMKMQSDAVMQKTFRNDLACKLCKLYDWNGNFLEAVEAKFIEPKEYSILQDQVEYQLEFRPDFHPEKKYDYLNTLGEKRMGFYIDIPDSVGDMERWLIWNRNDKKQFVKYSIVKTNWTFKWMVDGQLYSCRGIIRDKSSSGSGIWDDSRTTSVDGEAMIVVPMTDITSTIDYDMRFMLSTNKVRPLTYAVTKRSDMFPAGLIKIVLEQVRTDKATDNLEELIADYVPPVNHVNQECTIDGYTTIRNGGSARTFTASFTTDGVEDSSIIGVWTTDIPDEYLEYFDIDTSTTNVCKVTCRKNQRLNGLTITLTCTAEDKVGTYTTEVIA